MTYALIGLGMGSVVAPATTRILAALPPHRAGAGSAVQNTMRQVGGALGVAILGSVLSTVYGNQVLAAVGVLPPSASAASDSVGSTYDVVDRAGTADTVRRAGCALIDAANAAFIDAMNVVTIIVIAVLVTAAAVVFFFLPRHADPAASHQSPTHEHPREAPA